MRNYSFLATSEEKRMIDTAIITSRGKKFEFDAGTVLNITFNTAMQGDSEAQKFLGDIFMEGMGDLLQSDIPHAIKWYQIAAEQENEAALNQLVQLYNNGHIQFAELMNSVRNFKDKYDTLSPDIKFLLGKAHLDGLCCDFDINTALKYIKQVAKQGNMPAAMILVDFYLSGSEMVDPDPPKAIRLLEEMAIEHEYAPAQYKLAQIYEEGKFTNEKPKRAFKLYKKAAKNDYLEAIPKIIMCYKKGYGTESNREKARKWEKRLDKSGYLQIYINCDD
jgi:TPR repeat protein